MADRHEVRQTCTTPGCVVDVEWSDRAAGTIRATTPVRKCIVHALVPDARLWDVVTADNRLWNYVRTSLLGERSTVNSGIDLGENDPTKGGRRERPGVRVALSFRGTDEARVLRVQVTGETLTDQQRATALAAFDARFGPGRVEFV